MKKQQRSKDRLKNGFSFWCVLYPVCVILGFFIWCWEKLGMIERSGNQFPYKDKSVIIVSNHPTLLMEAFLSTYLWWPYLILHPSCIPWTVPDAKNFTEHWFWSFVKARFVSVPRDKGGRGLLYALMSMIKLLRAGFNMILFPEGGRTGTNNPENLPLKLLKPGVGRILSEVDCTVVHIWFEGTSKVQKIGRWWPDPRHKVRINIGDIVTNIADKDKKRRRANAEGLTERTKNGILAARRPVSTAP